MIDFFDDASPDALAVRILLEECRLPYALHRMPQYRHVAPQQRNASHLATAGLALRDPDGPQREPIHLEQAGAILLYLASKTGHLLPRPIGLRYQMLQWLMFPRHLLAAGRDRLHGGAAAITDDTATVRLEHALASGARYLVGTGCSIADILIHPWIGRSRDAEPRQELQPSTRQWFERVGNRASVRLASQLSQPPLEPDA